MPNGTVVSRLTAENDLGQPTAPPKRFGRLYQNRLSSAIDSKPSGTDTGPGKHKQKLRETFPQFLFITTRQ